jgi:hypothetical protein
MFVRERNVLKERTGAAKTSVPIKRKKEIYEERRIVVFLGRLEIMRCGVGRPAFIIHRIGSYSGLQGPHVHKLCDWCALQ